MVTLEQVFTVLVWVCGVGVIGVASAAAYNALENGGEVRLDPLRLLVWLAVTVILVSLLFVSGTGLFVIGELK